MVRIENTIVYLLKMNFKTENCENFKIFPHKSAIDFHCLVM